MASRRPQRTRSRAIAAPTGSRSPPTRLRPRISPERVLVIGAEADRITPLVHAEQLARHFEAPLLRVAGGHLVQVWRREAYRAVRAHLRRIDFV